MQDFISVFKFNDECSFVLTNENKLFKYLFSTGECVPILPEVEVNALKPLSIGGFVVEDKSRQTAYYDDNFNKLIDFSSNRLFEIDGCSDILQHGSYGKYGLISRSGKIIAEPIYGSIYYGEGIFTMNYQGENGPEVRFIDIEGNDIISAKPGIGAAFADGLCFISDKEWGEKTVGVINKQGEFVIPMEYKTGFAKSFTEGLAPFAKDGKWGFLNTKGEVAIPFSFAAARPFYEGVAAVSIKGMWVKYIYPSGEFVFDKLFKCGGDFHEGMAASLSDGTDKYDWNELFGFIDKSGNFVVEPKYTDPGEFKNGYAHVDIKNKQGLIDSNGNEIIPCVYSELDIRDNLIIVAKGKKYGIYGFDGQRIVTCKYNDIIILSSNHVAVKEKEDSPYLIIQF